MLIDGNWDFQIKDFREIIASANVNDIIYCDPPYFGRYVDYYNGWSDEDEYDLYKALEKSKAKFILSTWHHNNYRENLMIKKYWGKFNIVTKDHYYHSGGKLENRNSIVEALVFNFESKIKKHNYELIPKEEQLILFEKREKYITERMHNVIYE